MRFVLLIPVAVYCQDTSTIVTPIKASAQTRAVGNIQHLKEAKEADPNLITRETTLPQGALDSSLSCQDATTRTPLADQVYFIEEANRPGDFMPVFEDEHGTYIMNSKDLRAIEHVQKLVDIGIDSLKIEGRTKSHYYVARTAQAYRRAIDLAVAGEKFDRRLLIELEGLANRGYTSGFYQRHQSDETQNYLTGSSRSHQQEFAGEAILDAVTPDGWILVDVKNNFKVGDRLEFILPGKDNPELVLETMLDEKGQPISVSTWETVIKL